MSAPTELDMLRVSAKLKSYTGSAVLVFFLYLLFWLPGLIVNLIFRSEAKRTEQLAGQSLSGVGCLTVQLVLFGIALPTLGLLWVLGAVLVATINGSLF